MDKKLKILWICHFSNSNIQKKLKVRRGINEMAPWITLGIEEAKRRDDIELHVVSPHRWIPNIREFNEENIHYHFFNPGIPFYGRHWPSFFRFDLWTDFYLNKKVIKRFVKKIRPDIINLHGVENSYYSSSILQFKKENVLITIQGLKGLSVNKASSKIFSYDIKIEKEILRQFNNFGIRVSFLENYIKDINPFAKFYWFKYPFASSILPETNFEKKYDCVFFARVSKDKGVEDLIEALGILKEKGIDISLNIIGGLSSDYKLYLIKKLRELNIYKNVKILGFLNDKKEVHKYVAESKVTVLPTYNDILPGTIIESLKIGTPVISYTANGVVDFNKDDEIIKLIDIGNIQELAFEISNLLNDEKERETFRDKGLKWVSANANNSVEFGKLLDSYRKILQGN